MGFLDRVFESMAGGFFAPSPTLVKIVPQPACRCTLSIYLYIYSLSLSRAPSLSLSHTHTHTHTHTISLAHTYTHMHTHKRTRVNSLRQAQGQQFDNVLVDACGAWACGQLYTAFSRVRTLGGLFVRGWESTGLKAHNGALVYHFPDRDQSA